MPKIPYDMTRFSYGPRDPSLLLHPAIPPGLWGLNPRTILGKRWWQEERKKVAAAANYKCQACGVPRGAGRFKRPHEVHETYKFDWPARRATYTGAVYLCFACHSFIHRKRLLYTRAKRSLIRGIVVHGVKLVKRAGLTLPELPPEACIHANWQVVIDGRVYQRARAISFYDELATTEIEELHEDTTL